MDPLTHALIGSLVADALPFTKRMGYKAPLIGALAGMAPDLDMIPAIIAKFPPKSMRFSDLFDFALVRMFHRAYTHSFFYMAIGAVVFGFAAWRFSGRKGTWAQWSAMICLALFSHTVLDISNPWGVRAFLPFSQARPSMGILPLVDWFILGVAAGAFTVNHVLRSSYPGPDLAARRRFAWRERTAAFLDAHAGATTVGVVGALLVAGRFLQAWLMR